MSAIDKKLKSLRQEGRKALLPFVPAADPDMDFTVALLRALDAIGCGLVEVGFPYSDPIADGSVIQASYSRSLAKGVRVDAILSSLGSAVVARTLPLVGMVSYAIVHRRGMERFVGDVKKAGLEGLIVPDLLFEESSPLQQVCREKDVSLIQLVTPTTPLDRIVRIAEQASGFLYFVSVTGVTGARTHLPDELLQRLEWARNRTEIPVCVGFGISTEEQVRWLAPYVDGIIIGSALVRWIEKIPVLGRDAVISEIAAWLQSLMPALEGKSLASKPPISGDSLSPSH